LNRPDSVAVDANGAIYIAESSNFRVRRVDPSGTITTIAGTGSPLGAPGDGGPASQATLYGPTAVTVDKSGNVYINDNASIRKISFP
jgi:streptogramin lyase